MEPLGFRARLAHSFNTLRSHRQELSFFSEISYVASEPRYTKRRWIKGEAPALEGVLKTMRERAAKFNVEKIRPQDLAGAAGPPDESA